MGNIKSRLGQCYILSYKFVTDYTNKGYKLIHGYITNRFGGGQTIDHAWAEKDGEVYDPVLDLKADWEVYKALLNAVVDKEYSDVEAMKLASESGTYGPWHELKKLDLSMYTKRGNLKKGTM